MELYYKFEKEIYDASDDKLRDMLCRFNKEDFLKIPIMADLIAHKKISLLQELHEKGMPFRCELERYEVLGIACGAGGDLECVKFLVENNIETDIHENASRPKYAYETPLALAIAYRHYDIVDYFKEKFGIEKVSIGEVESIIDIEIDNFRGGILNRIDSCR